MLWYIYKEDNGVFVKDIHFLQKSSVFTIRNNYKNLFNMAWIMNTVNSSYICGWFFDDLLTVHLSIILGVDQLNERILFL